MSFTPNRPLLNPHFEGYKLSFSPSPHVAHVPLQHRAKQSRDDSHPLGFQQVASRVRHNHLSVGECADSAVYIAEDGSVVLISMHDDTRPAPSGAQNGGGVAVVDVVFRLPPATLGAASHAEYPAAAPITRDVWLISDGHGYAYLLRIARAAPPSGAAAAHLLARWQLLQDGTRTPFQLHTAALVQPGAALAVLTSPAPAPKAPSTAQSPATAPAPGAARAVFDIWAARVPVPDASPDITAQEPPPPIALEIAWRRRGTHIPLFVKHLATHGAFLFLGGCAYRDAAAPAASNGGYEPAPDELAPIPRRGEALDSPAAPPPPAYSWTQTADSVTVAFALPGHTPKSSIAAAFAARTLSLRAGAPAPLPAPHYAAAPLWDAIRPASSLWTWEPGGALSQAGLLTLHLDKAHAGTRWSHVFAQGFDAEVAETLDPSELAAIRESLDKYTAALRDDASGVGHGLPSLAAGERDDEIDADAGQPVVLTWVDTDGGSRRTPADDTPAVLLSLPLPGTPGPLTLVIRNDIDGPLFTLGDGYMWSHTATYPALAFVLASKRDTRFTFHVSSTVALAFDSGARDSGGGNVYLYHGSAPGDKSAKQSVFQMRPGVGALLGVGMLTSGAGSTVLLCLSERELTICSGFS